MLHARPAYLRSLPPLASAKIVCFPNVSIKLQKIRVTIGSQSFKLFTAVQPMRGRRRRGKEGWVKAGRIGMGEKEKGRRYDYVLLILFNRHSYAE